MSSKIKPMEDKPRIEDINTEEIVTYYTYKNSVRIFVSGRLFVVPRDVILRHPHTVLAEVFTSNCQLEEAHFFQDETVFPYILRYLKSGRLIKPPHVDMGAFEQELLDWKIDETNIEKSFDAETKEDSEIEDQLRKFGTGYSFLDDNTLSENSIQYRMWVFLTFPPGNKGKYLRTLSWLFAFLYLLIMIVQYALIETFMVPHSALKVPDNTSWAEHVCIISRKQTVENVIKLPDLHHQVLVGIISFYALEVIVRFISCPRKCRFFKSPHLMDATLVLLEFPIGLTTFAIPASEVLAMDISHCAVFAVSAWTVTSIGMFRMIRILILSSSIGGMKITLVTLIRSWKLMLMLLLTLIACSLVFAPILYMTNLGAPNELINNMNQAQWLVIVTMTTVGYGDFYAETIIGRYFTTIIMMTGITLTALPIAIIGNDFTKIYAAYQKIEREKDEANLKNIENSLAKL